MCVRVPTRSALLATVSKHRSTRIAFLTHVQGLPLTILLIPMIINKFSLQFEEKTLHNESRSTNPNDAPTPHSNIGLTKAINDANDMFDRYNNDTHQERTQSCRCLSRAVWGIRACYKSLIAHCLHTFDIHLSLVCHHSTSARNIITICDGSRTTLDRSTNTRHQ